MLKRDPLLFVRRILLGALSLVAALVLGFAVAGWLLVRPVQSEVGSAPPDLGARSVLFQSDSGTTVHAWWCPVRQSRGTVLLLPGIRADRLTMIERARFLRRASYSTLLLDFEASGESKGDRITFGWRESRDVLAARNFLRQTEPDAPVGIIGTSLGGAAALLASPPLKVDALILESVYPSIDQALQNRLQKYLGWPGKFLAPFLLWQLHPRLGIFPSQLRPIDHMNAIGPVLIMSGEDDHNTTVRDTRLLFSQALGPKELWLVPKAGHVDLYQAAPADYERRVLAFLGQNLIRARPR